jgi:hypothetical protein
MIKNPGFSFAFWKNVYLLKVREEGTLFLPETIIGMYVQEICCNLYISKSSIVKRKTFIGSGSAEGAANPYCGTDSG